MSNELAVIEYQGLHIVFEDGQPYLTQAQMAALFGINRDSVADVLRNVANKGFIDLESTTRRYRVVASDGKTREVNHYPMLAVNLVGFRVQEATPSVIAFQAWVTGLTIREMNYYKEQLEAFQAHTEQLTEALSEEQKERRDADYWAFRDKEHALKMLAELRHELPVENWE